MSKSVEIFAVILAGGVGTRFWPMSRSSKPKQFLDILGTGKSLIKMTYERLAASVPPENILIVTNEDYRSTVSEHLPALPARNILCEPCMRNTAPCIAYANAVISGRVDCSASDAVVIVAPSDHLILDSSEFGRIVNLAVDNARSSDSLVTLGIKPSRPDTGYGYIKYSGAGEVAEVELFTEKPDLKTAEGFLSEGGYCWNSGIFVWSLASINSAFREFLPELSRAFKEGQFSGEPGEVDKVYPDCESISIDYGVLEKADNVKVIPSDFGWSDLGTWNSLASHLPSDESGNHSSGVDLIANSSEGNVIVGQDGKTVAIKGLKDFIVVDTPDALLLCPRSDEQWVKELVGQLKSKK
jgi:mannose-1-phosphate guanylyltransferase